MWKFQKFSAAQILREINVENSKNFKNCQFCSFRGSEFHFLKISKKKNHLNLTSFSLKKFKNGNFWQFYNPKNWFHIKSCRQKTSKISTLCSHESCVSEASSRIFYVIPFELVLKNVVNLGRVACRSKFCSRACGCSQILLRFQILPMFLVFPNQKEPKKSRNRQKIAKFTAKSPLLAPLSSPTSGNTVCCQLSCYAKRRALAPPIGSSERALFTQQPLEK